VSCDGLWLYARNGVFVGEATGCILRLEQPLEFDVIEADQIETVILFVQNRQLDAKHFFVPRGPRECELIVRDYQGAPLCGRQMAEDDYRWCYGPIQGP
jgi:hypothetical protein